MKHPKRCSKLIALLLAVAMLVSLFPLTVAAHGAEDQENLALSATVSASSEHSAAPMKNVNDGDTSNKSRWSAAKTYAEDLPIWIQLNWDEAVTFDNVVVYEWTSSLRSGTYNLSISDDGETFTVIHSGDQIGEKKSILLDESVTAKHLRLTITSIREGQKETCSINEIQVFANGLANDPNLARRATATAINAPHPNYPASRINDGTTTGDNRWSSTGYMNDTGVWVQLNWDAAVTFDQVRVWEWESSIRAKDFTLSVSDDGENFTTIFTGQGLGRGRNIYLDTPVTAKHLRLHMTSTLTGSNDAPSLSEVEVYLSGLSAEPNLARRAWASTNSPRGGYGPELVNDGITFGIVSRWVAQDAQAMPIWVQLNWDYPVTFDTVKIFEWPGSEGYRTDEYKLEISDDGENWTQVDAGNGLGKEKTIALEEIATVKHLRLTLISIQAEMLQNEKPCINEIEVYNYSNDATIHSARILGSDAVIDQQAGTVTFSVDPQTDITKVTPDFTVAGGAVVSPTGPQDFTEPVTYTVTAKDGVTVKQYVVMADVIQYLTDADLADHGAEDVAAFGPVPSPYQYTYQRQELAAFLHFNMNTFTGSEWGNGKESPSQFTLTEKVDADAYVKTLKDAGFQKLIVTAKHHDGFCIWDSAWTEHDTMSTNYPGGDVLADISAACTKYDMDMGLYLSPWDENSVYYGYYDADGNPTTKENDVLDYNDYYAGQLAEILGNPKYGNNGRFVEVWMDGAKGSGADAQDYDFDRYIETIQKLQGKASGADDDVLLFGAGKYTTVRWIGNESGVANEETWSKAMASYDAAGNLIGLSSGSSTIYKNNNVSVGVKSGNKWSVPEVDARITSGWFWGEGKKTPKTLEALRDMYLDSVGHNAPLLLNVPLNNRGKLDEAIRLRVLDWGQNVRESFFENNLAAAEGVTISASGVEGQDLRFKPSNVADGSDDTYWTAGQGEKTASLMIDFGKEVLFDALTLEEEIHHGQRVEGFSVLYKSAEGQWVEYANGTTIGGKRVILGKPVRATEVKINFDGMTDGGVNATPVISHVGVYKSTEAFQLGSAAPKGITEIDSSASNFVSDAETVKDLNAIGNSYLLAKAGETVTVTFSGTKAWLVGLDSDAVLEISVDGGAAETAAVSGTDLYETGDLSVGEHTMTVRVVSGSVKADVLYVLNNGGKGLLDFEYDTYTVDEDMWFTVKVVREGGTTGTISAIVQDNPGSAVQSSYVPTEGLPVVFADGEKEKTVSIRTKRYTEETGTLSFTLDLVAGDGETGLVTGFRTPALVNIIDAESYPGGYLQAIEVTRLPDKTDYVAGDDLDPTGLVVTGTYRCQPEWNEIASGSGLGRGKTIKLEEPVTAARLRLTLLSVLSGVTDVPCISEIEVYNGGDATNLARSAVPTAISEHGHPNGYKANRLNDGITTGDNRWSAANAIVANGGLPAWVQLNWDEPVTFDTIVIYEWEQQTRADDWKLETSTADTVKRPMDAEQYELDVEKLTEAGETVVTVTAKEDASKTAAFTVQVQPLTDVTLAITGDAQITLDQNEVSFTVSASNTNRLATATLELTLDTKTMSNPIVEGLNGWYVIAQTYADGKLNVVMGNNAGMTGAEAADMLKLTAGLTGKVGSAAVEITAAKLSGYTEAAEEYVPAVLGEQAKAVTEITYSIYDVNQDGVVNQLDLTRTQRAYGASAGDENWNPRADVNGDGTVGIDDLILILNHYSK